MVTIVSLLVQVQAGLNAEANLTFDGSTLTNAGATQLNSTLTIGANDQGYDVILYGDTASANVTWDTSVDDLIFNGGAGLIVPDGQLTLGSTAVTSTAAELNLLDGKDATHLAVPGKFGGTNFARSIIIGHSTTGTLNDAVNNTGVGEASLEDITTGDDNTAVGRRSLKDLNSGGANTALGSEALKTVTSNSGNTGIGRSALSLTVGTNNIGLGLGAGSNITSGSGNIIIGADTNADSASGDRQLKIAGYDGSTTTTWISGDSSGNLTFAANTTIGGNLIIGSATVTEAQLEVLDGATITTTELNLIDGGATVGTTAFADGDGILHNDGGTMRVTSATTLKTYMSDLTLTTAAQTNITSVGTLTALTVDNMVHNGDAIVMTPSTNDTVTMTAATNGAFSLVTVDTAAAAANIQITADGTFEVDATTITLDSAGDINLDAGGNNITLKSGGTSILDFVNSSSDVIIKPMVDAKDIIFQQYDGTSILEINDGAYAKFTAAAVAPEATLTDASTVTWNSLTQSVAKVTLGGNRTMGLASGGVTGAFISLLVIQDGTGSRTITWNAAYEFAADTAPTLTTTANLGDLFVFRYNGAKWLETGRNLALTLS